MTNYRKIITETIDDLVQGFLIYDRVGDDELSQEDLLNAVRSGHVSEHELVQIFKKALFERLQRLL